MKLKQALFRIPNASIFQVDDDDGSFLEWEVEPIGVPTLASDHVRDENFEGLFILKAFQISPKGEVKDCYLDIAMPERISETAYLESNGKIIAISIYENIGYEVIPAVAIEGLGNYELFYSRINPEIGLNVLKSGLNLAKRRGHIAEDMAYILRDEGRKLEAIEAFDIVISEGEPTEYTYLERSALREEIGDFTGTSRDRDEAARIGKMTATSRYK